MSDELDELAAFMKIVNEEDRRDRIYRGEPTHTEMMRFAAEEMDSPIAPEGFTLHPSHLPQSVQEMLANDTDHRYCQNCCLVLTRLTPARLTIGGADPCPGKRTLALDQATDRLVWVML